MRHFPIIVAALATAVVSTAAFAHGQKLEGTEWSVVGDQGDKARYISFAGSGRVFGFGGCNRFTGSYEQHDHHVLFSGIAATKMACPADAMQKEQEFLDALSKVESVTIDHTVMLLLDASGADLKALTRRETGGGSDEEP